MNSPERRHFDTAEGQEKIYEEFKAIAFRFLSHQRFNQIPFEDKEDIVNKGLYDLLLRGCSGPKEHLIVQLHSFLLEAARKRRSYNNAAKRNRRRTVPLPTAKERTGKEFTAYHHAFEELELNMDLRELIPEKLQAVLHYQRRGYEQLEIAALLDITDRTVRRDLKDIQDLLHLWAHRILPNEVTPRPASPIPE